MEYRELGNTGLSASVIGMGCEGFSEDEYRMCGRMFDAAQRLGINYFDLYASDPKVRKAVGDALKGRREKFIIQSHICSVWKNGQYMRTRDLAQVKAGFEEMMSLLQTDYIDVGMIHYCDAMKDWEAICANGILDYARELKKAGRIRHIGLSSHNLFDYTPKPPATVDDPWFSLKLSISRMPCDFTTKREQSTLNEDPERVKF